ncbi:gp12 short tail fibers [Aeromonas phage Aeh1]|uniref:Gp12 short tail fibers n=1 Tax=Aeromonas phage Aeh1 TaxID=2880362 RepID=Q76YM5_9CAUD|nr:tail collar fiber protein [Aeromonas phage Aeh1]AAQ17871.1 gp12 short tail fibers [Aeromonas phage Aeh1]
MRTNNITQHISSKAGSVVFDPASAPAFDTTITDLQKLGNKIDAHATKPLPVASETVSGIAELATVDEVLLGNDKVRLVTPYTLQQKWARPNASDTVYGLVRYNTVAEREEAAAKVDVTVNTASLWDVVRNKSIATESKRGSVSISTLVAAKAGVDDTTAMTPAKVKAAIDTFAVTSVSGATETVTGTVKNSPALITNAALHTGYAVTPKGFIETRAAQARVGTVRMATQAEANARTLGDVAISPATLPIASDTQYGITALLHNAQSGVTNKALSAHGATLFINRNGDSMTGDLTVHNIFTANGQNGRGDSLTRKDYVDGLFNQKANISHTHGTPQESWTLIWQGPLDRGNFVTNQPWWNFDALVIESSRDGGSWFNTMEISRWQIEQMQAKYPNFNLVSAQEYYWFGKFRADGMYFDTHTENCYLWRIYGVNKTWS